MVLLTALIRDLAASCGPVDILTSGPWSEPLLREQPGVGEVFTVRSRKMPYWASPDQQRAVRWLRSRGVGPVWYCDANDAAMTMLARAGIPSELIVNVKDHPLLPGEHATQQWHRLARIVPRSVASSRAGAAPGGGTALAADAATGNASASSGTSAGVSAGCCLELTDGQRADLENWLYRRGLSSVPLIAIQVGNKRTMRRGLRRLATNNKYWPIPRWATVLQHIRRRQPRHAIVMLGTGPERALNSEVIAMAGIDGSHNAAGDLPIPRLVALLARAQGLLTVDSGPAHVAAAVGCPQVVLFGKASTSLYRPWGTAGADVRVLTGEVDGQPSMLGIEVKAVTAAWDSLKLRSS